MKGKIVIITFKGKSRECVAGQIIVKVHEDAAKDPDAIHNLISEILGSKTSFQIISSFDQNGIGLIDVGQADLESIINALEQNKKIVFAEPNDVTRASTIPSITPVDPLFSQQWSLLTIQAPAAWALTQGSNDVVIAIIDSGIPLTGSPPALSHEDLSNPDRLFLGTNYIKPGIPPIDDHGHGTHVSGIAAAESNNSKGIAGLNWKCRIFVCKVFDNKGAGSNFYLYEAIKESVAFAKAKNWRLVINYSGQSRTYSNIMEEIGQVVQQGNALLCAAAGNDASTVGYPAALSTHDDGSIWYENIVAVSATTMGDELATFSNRGIQINLAAPGVDILSTLPNYHVTLNDPPVNKKMNYDTLSGTSMATPIVSGIAALAWSVFPTLNPAQLKDRLQKTAVDLPPPGKDSSFGYGRINAFAAITSTLPPTPIPIPTNPWENPVIQQWLDEWIQQADRCLKKKYPAAYIDKWGRGCGNFGNTTVNCNNSPAPPGWTPHQYLWTTNSSAFYYPYRIREYVSRRQAGESFTSLTKCK